MLLRRVEETQYSQVMNISRISEPEPELEKGQSQDAEFSIVEATQEEIAKAAWRFSAKFAHSRKINQAYDTDLPDLTVSLRSAELVLTSFTIGFRAE